MIHLNKRNELARDGGEGEERWMTDSFRTFNRWEKAGANKKSKVSQGTAITHLIFVELLTIICIFGLLVSFNLPKAIAAVRRSARE